MVDASSSALWFCCMVCICAFCYFYYYYMFFFCFFERETFAVDFLSSQRLKRLQDGTSTGAKPPTPPPIHPSPSFLRPRVQNLKMHFSCCKQDFTHLILFLLKKSIFFFPVLSGSNPSAAPRPRPRYISARRRRCCNSDAEPRLISSPIPRVLAWRQ